MLLFFFLQPSIVNSIFLNETLSSIIYILQKFLWSLYICSRNPTKPERLYDIFNWVMHLKLNLEFNAIFSLIWNRIIYSFMNRNINIIMDHSFNGKQTGSWFVCCYCFWLVFSKCLFSLFSSFETQFIRVVISTNQPVLPLFRKWSDAFRIPEEKAAQNMRANCAWLSLAYTNLNGIFKCHLNGAVFLLWILYRFAKGIQRNLCVQVRVRGNNKKNTEWWVYTRQTEREQAVTERKMGKTALGMRKW